MPGVGQHTINGVGLEKLAKIFAGVAGQRICSSGRA
jgi:hypothetical protein